MQYLMTFFWTFLLSEMTVYVVSSMNGAVFHFETGVFLAIVLTILLVVITTLIPNDPIEKH
ncbi:YjzD family protein [Domibacillus robiginosus]|uniref:YjzD family protein n=1 Tax=Domibacillus robiginosus TaxID=1071054 RepID=UPI00067A9D26|nr:YjzD family protein [Domibacillus robiginosus]